MWLTFLRWAWRGLKIIKGFLPAAWLDLFLKAFGIWSDNATAKHRIDAEVEIAGIGAELETRKLAAQQLILEHGWWVTRWIRPLFAYPLIVYFAAIVADKLLHLKWEAEPLPAPLDEWAGWIVTAYFLVRGFEKSMRWFKPEESK